MSDVKPASETPVSGNMGFAHWLGLLFIGLKLGGILQWDWFYVLMPIWLL